MIIVSNSIYKIDKMSTYATYYGGNSWLIEMDKVKILIDPWFCGDLTFFNTELLLKGKKNDVIDFKFNEKIDLILITQGLEDHCHKETLSKLPCNTQTIASKSAGEILRGIGYKNVKVLIPDEKINFMSLTIQATAGAKVPFQENGYLISSKERKLYIEPHGYLDATIKDKKIDIIITPVVDAYLLFIFEIIRGAKSLNVLIDKFKPDVVLASTTGGDITFTGLVSRLITQRGSFPKLQNSINKATRLLNPKVNKRYDLTT